MKFIEKVKFQNYGRFKELVIQFDSDLNLLIGDNESGKSTILTAIDIVLSGSKSKIESIGLDSIFNSDTILKYLSSEKKIEDLPSLYIEVYLNNQLNKDLDGRNNSLNQSSHGLYMLCEPRLDLSKEIKEILNQPEHNFPFEYYSIEFKTFSGSSYSGYRKFMHHLLLDSTQINNEYATRSYIRTLYHSNISESEKNKNQNEYRKYKESFKDSILSDLNNRISDYSFTVKTNSKSNLETDLTIKEGDIEIENKGKGRQCFIKTDFALRKNENELDVILLEEPENHLSHINMKKLIQKIDDSEKKQIIIATHSNLISSRLDLRKAKLLNSNSDKPISLNDLNEDTSRFFMKAPDNSILEYIMSKKVILVEGAAEYILLEKFFETETGEKLETSDVHLISVGGTSFKRYLDLGILLGIRTAVIRDNDGDYDKNITEAFQDYCNEYINVYADVEKENWTFEVAIYKNNSELCDDLFSEGRRSLSVQNYMLSNKADCAFELLNKRGNDIHIPDYIVKALQWIKA